LVCTVKVKIHLLQLTIKVAFINPNISTMVHNQVLIVKKKSKMQELDELATVEDF
jgi:hypothetical protein